MIKCYCFAEFTVSLWPYPYFYMKPLTTYSRCRPTITFVATDLSGVVFSLSCFRCSLRSPRQQEQGPSEPVYYASFCLFKTSLDRVNIISGRASRSKRGMQATFPVIILWDNYFIITPLYLSLCNWYRRCLFSLYSHPPLPWESHPWLDARVTGGHCGRFRRADK